MHLGRRRFLYRRRAPHRSGCHPWYLPVDIVPPGYVAASGPERVFRRLPIRA
ncbi:hypothetical protein EBESD8_5190 [Rhodococcus aetherivorans]|nr:hypothetical protein EBESD8_5190 [Rhodococcus aetherivorans]